MTNDGKPIYCWDASVFLAWINEEAGAVGGHCLIGSELSGAKMSLAHTIELSRERPP
ncbi:MAG TPA: hypothetical protein VNH11_11770 [Pirellulales bacterium]|nr:hypothetical protein [Pirellulales bacterium]